MALNALFHEKQNKKNPTISKCGWRMKAKGERRRCGREQPSPMRNHRKREDDKRQCETARYRLILHDQNRRSDNGCA